MTPVQGPKQPPAATAPEDDDVQLGDIRMGMSRDCQELPAAPRDPRKPRGLIMEESTAVGSVPLRVYLAYIKRAGGWPFAVSAVLMFAGIEASFGLSDYWLSRWTDDDAPDTSYYIRVYFLLGFSNALFVLLRALVFAVGTVRAARSSHHDLLHGILRAPVAFFDRTPTGRIVNRFSMDQLDVDHILPHFFEHCLLCFFHLLMVAILISVLLPVYAAVVVVLAGVFVVVARFYSRSLLELKVWCMAPV